MREDEEIDLDEVEDVSGEYTPDYRKRKPPKPPEEETEEERKARRNRERQRKWYKRNRKKKKALRKRHAERTDYFKRWYERNKKWHKARVKLRSLCRPDISDATKWRYRWPGLETNDILFDEATAIECERYYWRRLKELREKFDRDPFSGRKDDDTNSSEG